MKICLRLVAVKLKRPRSNLALAKNRKPAFTHPGLWNWIVTRSRYIPDPLVHHGRHFGRTVHALCNIQALLTNGLLRMGELSDEAEETSTYEYAF